MVLPIPDAVTQASGRSAAKLGPAAESLGSKCRVLCCAPPPALPVLALSPTCVLAEGDPLGGAEAARGAGVYPAGDPAHHQVPGADQPDSPALPR